MLNTEGVSDKFFLEAAVDLSCPNCPATETDQYVEFHYRRAHGTLTKLHDYADRIRRYWASVDDLCCPTVCEIVAMLLHIPDHRRKHDQACFHGNLKPASECVLK